MHTCKSLTQDCSARKEWFIKPAVPFATRNAGSNPRTRLALERALKAVTAPKAQFYMKENALSGHSVHASLVVW